MPMNLAMKKLAWLSLLVWDTSELTRGISDAGTLPDVLPD